MGRLIARPARRRYEKPCRCSRCRPDVGQTSWSPTKRVANRSGRKDQVYLRHAANSALGCLIMPRWYRKGRRRRKIGRLQGVKVQIARFKQGSRSTCRFEVHTRSFFQGSFLSALDFPFPVQYCHPWINKKHVCSQMLHRFLGR